MRIIYHDHKSDIQIPVYMPGVYYALSLMNCKNIYGALGNFCWMLNFCGCRQLRIFAD